MSQDRALESKAVAEDKSVHLNSRYVYTQAELSKSPGEFWHNLSTGEDSIDTREVNSVKRPWRVVSSNGNAQPELLKDAERGFYLGDAKLWSPTTEEIASTLSDYQKTVDATNNQQAMSHEKWITKEKIKAFLEQKKNKVATQNFERLDKEYTQWLMGIGLSFVKATESVDTTFLGKGYNYWRLFYSPSDDQFYFEVELADFLISGSNDDLDDPASTNKRAIPGSVKLLYLWREDVGFELKEAGFSNKALAQLSVPESATPLTVDQLRNLLNQAWQEETEYKTALANLSETLTRLDSKNLFKQPGMDLVKKAKRIAAFCPEDKALLGEVLYQTNRLIRNEDDRTTGQRTWYEYEQLIGKVNQKRNWGWIVAGAMLAVVGAAVVGLCLASGFGAIALPFLVLAAKYLITATALGGAVAVVGVGLTSSGFWGNKALPKLAKDCQGLKDIATPPKKEADVPKLPEGGALSRAESENPSPSDQGAATNPEAEKLTAKVGPK